MEKNKTVNCQNSDENSARPASQSFSKIKKPNRKKEEAPRILINDRKKASYDLYTIGKKPQE